MVKPDEELVACRMMLAHRRREVLLERAEEIRTGYSHSPLDGRVVWSGAFDMPWDWHAAAKLMTRQFA
jgi:hypothetical protein